MPELKYKPVPHEHKAFLAKSSARKGFTKAYEALALEYQLALLCDDRDSQANCNDDKA